MSLHPAESTSADLISGHVLLFSGGGLRAVHGAAAAAAAFASNGIDVKCFKAVYGVSGGSWFLASAFTPRGKLTPYFAQGMKTTTSDDVIHALRASNLIPQMRERSHEEKMTLCTNLLAHLRHCSRCGCIRKVVSDVVVHDFAAKFNGLLTQYGSGIDVVVQPKPIATWSENLQSLLWTHHASSDIEPTPPNLFAVVASYSKFFKPREPVWIAVPLLSKAQAALSCEVAVFNEHNKITNIGPLQLAPPPLAHLCATAGSAFSISFFTALRQLIPGLGELFGDKGHWAKHPLFKHTQGTLQIAEKGSNEPMNEHLHDGASACCCGGNSSGETVIHARDAGTLESNVALENAAAIGAKVVWIVDDGAGQTLGQELRCREAERIGIFHWVAGDPLGVSWGIYASSTSETTSVVVYLVGITSGPTMEVPDNDAARISDIASAFKRMNDALPLIQQQLPLIRADIPRAIATSETLRQRMREFVEERAAKAASCAPSCCVAS